MRSRQNRKGMRIRQDRKGMRTRQKNEGGNRKGEFNDSPEIPDRRRASDIPGLPSGAESVERAAHCSQV